MLDVAAILVASDVRADGGAGNGTTGRCNVLSASATDLVTQHAAEHASDNGARNIRAAVVFAPFHPAALVRRTHHRANRCDLSLEHALVGAAIVVIPLLLRGLRRCRSDRRGRG